MYEAGVRFENDVYIKIVYDQTGGSATLTIVDGDMVSENTITIENE